MATTRPPKRAASLNERIRILRNAKTADSANDGDDDGEIFVK